MVSHSCLNLFHPVFYISREGGWEEALTTHSVERGCVRVHAMDLVIHAAAFGLGMKKSTVRFPWEREPVNPVFFKRPRLISPPVFAPLSKPVEDAVFLPREQAEGKLKWSKKTSLVPWPVVQDRALARVLES